MAEEPIVNTTLLAVTSVAEDCASLSSILRPPFWNLRWMRTLGEARIALHTALIGAVISEVSFVDGHGWRDLLREIQDMADPPPLIVAGCEGNESLWAEVLNLGGWDLLMKPFDSKEVLQVLRMACRVREFEQRKAPQRKLATACGM